VSFSNVKADDNENFNRNNHLLFDIFSGKMLYVTERTKRSHRRLETNQPTPIMPHSSKSENIEIQTAPAVDNAQRKGESAMFQEFGELKYFQGQYEALRCVLKMFSPNSLIESINNL
jgi:hypothetical protein